MDRQSPERFSHREQAAAAWRTGRALGVEYRQLGRSGLTVSVVGLGCNNFGGSSSSADVAAYGALDLEQTRAVVDRAYDCGVTLFDTANIYGNGGSETFLGSILQGRRDSVVLATKWGGGEQPGVAWGSQRYIRDAVEASLRRLGTDYIDLYQLHWPDPLTPIEETLAALDELVRAGKVRYVGSSHLSGWEVVHWDWTARNAGLCRPVSAQNEYSLLQRDADTELLPACQQVGVGLLAYFPLASGLLTGKYRRDSPAPAGARLAGRPIDADVYERLEALESFAGSRGRTLLELAIGAVASVDGVDCVVTGATRPEQIAANVEAVRWCLDYAELAELSQLTVVA